MSVIMNWFKAIILVQLFFSVAITSIAYYLPAESYKVTLGFTDVSDGLNLEDISTDVEASFRKQADIPVIEIGALVFYSGNILIDLMLNFAFALPEMIGLIINGILMLINIESQLFIYAQLFASVALLIMYFLGLMQLLTSVRSGRVIT